MLPWNHQVTSCANHFAIDVQFDSQEATNCILHPFIFLSEQRNKEQERDTSGHSVIQEGAEVRDRLKETMKMIFMERLSKRVLSYVTITTAVAEWHKRVVV